MSGAVLRLRPPDDAAFAPFGRLVTGPEAAGERKFFSDSLYDHPAASAPVLHVNKVEPATLPLTVNKVEQHPFASQCFFPMDVARYVTLVMPSDAEGVPKLQGSLAFLMPGTMGVIYKPGVWHMGATVLEQAGHFVVLMWRGGKQEDDIFRPIPPITLTS